MNQNWELTLSNKPINQKEDVSANSVPFSYLKVGARFEHDHNFYTKRNKTESTIDGGGSMYFVNTNTYVIPLGKSPILARYMLKNYKKA